MKRRTGVALYDDDDGIDQQFANRIIDGRVVRGRSQVKMNDGIIGEIKEDRNDQNSIY
jgi:hypothetical protein